MKLSLTLKFCLAVCQNKVLDTTEDVITSPDYPQQYPRLTDCDWNITVILQIYASSLL